MIATTELIRKVTTVRVTLALGGPALNGHNVQNLERTLMQQAGVRYAYVCAATEMAYVVYDPMQVRPEQLMTAVEQAGFRAETPEPR